MLIFTVLMPIWESDLKIGKPDAFFEMRIVRANYFGKLTFLDLTLI